MPLTAAMVAVLEPVEKTPPLRVRVMLDESVATILPQEYATETCRPVDPPMAPPAVVEAGGVMIDIAAGAAVSSKMAPSARRRRLTCCQINHRSSQRSGRRKEPRHPKNPNEANGRIVLIVEVPQIISKTEPRPRNP